MTFYRIRCREGSSGKTYVVREDIPSLGEVYHYIAFHGNSSSTRKYYIDKYDLELFSVVTAKVATKRWWEIQGIKEEAKKK